MKLRHAGTWIAMAWAGLAAAGCILAPEMRAMRREIESQVPGAEFEHEFSLSLGPTAFVARVQEEDEAVWVLTYEEDGIVRQIYVMAVNAEELVLARIEGDMDRIVARALEEHPFDSPERISRR